MNVIAQVFEAISDYNFLVGPYLEFIKVTCFVVSACFIITCFLLLVILASQHDYDFLFFVSIIILLILLIIIVVGGVFIIVGFGYLPPLIISSYILNYANMVPSLLTKMIVTILCIIIWTKIINDLYNTAVENNTYSED